MEEPAATATATTAVPEVAPEDTFPWVAVTMVLLLGFGLWWLVAGDPGELGDAPANR